MQMEPILHLRACPAFPAKPLQPASDLLSQKGQPLYAHSYRFRRNFFLPRKRVWELHPIPLFSKASRRVPPAVGFAPVQQKSKHRSSVPAGIIARCTSERKAFYSRPDLD